MAIKYKSLPLTIILSILYPGLGHYYVGAYLTGLIWAIVGFITQWFIYSCYCSPLKFSEAGGWPYVVVYAGIILASSIRAYITAVQLNQHLELLAKTKKNEKQKEHGYDLLKRR